MDMKRFSCLPACAGLVLMLASGCTVKENRDACPCLLDILVSGELSSPELVVNISDDTAPRLSEVVRLDGDNRHHCTSVPRCVASLCAFCRNGGLEISGNRMLISPGCQSDSLYTHHAYVDCTGESAFAEIHPLKQFASIYLRVMSEAYALRPGDEVLVTGNICGYDMETDSPVRGEFRYSTRLDDDMSCVFRVPRQLDGSLSLSIVTSSDSYSFAAGEQIVRAGYDWQEDALKDILLDIDLARMGIEVSVEDWTVIPVQG